MTVRTSDAHFRPVSDSLRYGADEAGVQLLRPDGHFRTLGEIEGDVVLLAIQRCGYISKAAMQLRIGRSTLHRKLKELEEKRPLFRWK